MEAIFPHARIQTCIVHLLRYSMHFGSRKERKAVAQALRPIYLAGTAVLARQQLEGFAAGPWWQKCPMIVEVWKRNWEHVILSFAFPDIICKIIYTTNAVEALHSRIRKAVQLRCHFPSDEAALKLLWLVLRNVAARWKIPPIFWHQVKAELAI